MVSSAKALKLILIAKRLDRILTLTNPNPWISVGLGLRYFRQHHTNRVRRGKDGKDKLAIL